MKKPAIITLLSVMFSVFGLLHGQTDMDITELTRGVVKIIVGKHQVDRGTGIVIGQESNKLFILTASHVVGKSKKVSVQFCIKDKSNSSTRESLYKDKGKVVYRTNFGDNIPKRTDSDLDIAFIEFEVSFKDFPFKSFPPMGIGNTSRIKNFEKVISFCYYDIGIFPVESKFQMIPLEKKFCITRESISPGCSGGPVFDEHENILGIVLFEDEKGAVATRIDSILKKLEEWNNESKRKISTNLLTNSRICYIAINSAPTEAEIYVGNDYKGKTPGRIRLLSENLYELKIMKPKYSTYLGTISCHTGDIDVKLTEILPPPPPIRPFQSLGSEIITAKGKMLTVNETFDFSTLCSEYWLCFMDDEMIWPRVKISEAVLVKTVTVPSSGFNGGKLVLVCVVEQVGRQFKNWLESGSDNALSKPDKYNIILQTNIKIGGTE